MCGKGRGEVTRFCVYIRGGKGYLERERERERERREDEERLGGWRE